MSAIVLLVLRLLLSLALYTFLGYALFVLWRDFKGGRDVLVSQKPAALKLEFTLGGARQEHLFRSPEVTLGRDLACDCNLDSETVSARHARLSYHHGQWWLEDLGSTNGTYLNQELLMEPTVVTDGDTFRCGEVSLIISKEQEEEP